MAAPRLGRLSSRLLATLIAMALILALFVVKLVDIQVVRAAELESTAQAEQSRTSTVSATRGRILDRNGVVLAETVLRYRIVVDQRNVADYRERDDSGADVIVTPESVAAKLASIGGTTTSTVLAALTGTKSYAVVLDNLDTDAYEQVRTLNVPWLIAESTPHRTYPLGAVGSNLVGFLGTDETPLAGIEYQQNACLAGTDGEESYLVSAASSAVRIPGTTSVTKQVENGEDVTLTIDSDVQWYAQQVAAAQRKALNSTWVSIVVMDAKTGDLLAVADAPTVDSSNYEASDQSDWGSRSFQAAVEPGSTMKSLTATTVIDQGKATPRSTFTVPGSRTTEAGTTFSDAFVHGKMKWTLTGIMRFSSNVGITMAGKRVSDATRYEYLKKFGLGEITNVGFPGEASGKVAPSDQWDVHTSYTEMFGQGVSVTPVQMVGAYQAIANDGQRISPRLVSGCTDDTGTVTENPSAAPVTVASASATKSVRKMLEEVVTEGGAPAASVSGYRVAGKTGTAQIAANGGYLKNQYMTSFIGMAPAEAPEYVVGMFVYKSNNALTSYNATPGFSAVMEYVLKHEGVAPSTTKPSKIPLTW